MKTAYVDLVGKQNEIIERQLREIEEQDAVAATSDDVDAQIKQLCGEYKNVETCLEHKLAKIEQLTSELNTLISERRTEMPNKSRLDKTKKRLHASIELDRHQTDKLRSMDTALERIDDIISLKLKSVETLESELKRLEELALASENVEMTNIRPSATGRVISKSTSTSSTTSSHSSTSSLFTSISSINSQSSVHNYQMQMNANSSANKSCQSYSGNDNESDTGISSANSDDFSTQQLETLV